MSGVVATMSYCWCITLSLAIERRMSLVSQFGAGSGFSVGKSQTCCHCHSGMSSSDLLERSILLVASSVCSSWMSEYMPCMSLSSRYCIALTVALFCLAERLRTCSLWNVSKRLFFLAASKLLRKFNS